MDRRAPIFFVLAALTLGGCTGSRANAPDPSDLLLRHLVARERELAQQLTEQENVTLAHDTRCIETRIALLEGRPNPHREPSGSPNQVAQESADRLTQDLNRKIARDIQSALDAQAWIEDHNRRHPEGPWAGVEDAIKTLCGDCAAERAARDKALKREAKLGN